jgi:aryl-alcohol dehydrogenase-like predicted oxidoreductase
MGVLTWSPLGWGFLTGRYRKGQPVDLTSGRAALNNGRFDPSLPVNARKLELVEDLVELASGIGVSLPELAIAFPVAHPAVTSVIIGPRTMDQLTSALKAAEVTLEDATLDRIDEIVPPGTDVYRADGAWQPPSIAEATLRRLPVDERAAG